MNDLLLIPTFDRPELLWLCLEFIAKSPDCRSVQITIYVDAHVGQPQPSHADIDAVVEKFPQLHLQVAYRPPHRFHGNSFNVLMAYKEAYERTDAQYVFLVEDDIMVHPRFFAWHRQVQGARPLDCSIGVMKRPEHAHYASWGVCFRREVIAKVLPHCQPAYFQDMNGYCHRTFPPAKFYCEQDGLWCRVLSEREIEWPRLAMAQHVGWYGYHRQRSQRPNGTLDQRFAQVKRVLSSAVALHSVARDFGDVEPLSLGN